MRRVYIAALHRKRDVGPQKLFGNMYVIDWDTKEFLREPKGMDPGYSLYNPSSNSHGVRSLSFHEGKLYVAGSGSVLSSFDVDTYKLLKSNVYSEFQSLHQIRSYNGFLYVVSTSNNNLYKLVNDEIVETVELKDFREYIEPHISSSPNGWNGERLHFNAIGWGPNGDEYHSYCAHQLLFNFTKKEVFYQGGELAGPHDISFIGDNLIVSSSSNKKTLSINIRTKEVNKIQEVKPEKVPDYLKGLNEFGFTRGVAVHKNKVFVCSTPTRVVIFNYDPIKDHYSLEEEFNISDEPIESISDIVLDPRDWI